MLYLFRLFQWYEGNGRAAEKLKVAGVTSTERRPTSASGRFISSVRAVAASSEQDTKIIHGHCELDSHADTIVCGRNCVLLAYSGRECDVYPYTEDYKARRNVPIVSAATAWQSQVTGKVYILVFNEALWMPELDCTLINPNQLRHFGISVQDDPTSDSPLFISTESDKFVMPLEMTSTTIFANTCTPTQDELETCKPHIAL